jgi:hypothetical protein
MLPKLDVTNCYPPQTFTVFPELPPGLRLKIWRIAAFHPRAFDFDYLHLNLKERVRLYDDLKDRLRKVPSVLQVNRESRTEALMHYTSHLERGFDAWGTKDVPSPDTEKSEWVSRHGIGHCHR